MAAYLVGHITVKDDGLWQQYVTGVQESLAPFESRIVFRGQLVEIRITSYNVCYTKLLRSHRTGPAFQYHP